MADPLAALRKATTIGPEPLPRPTLSMMPLPPWGGPIDLAPTAPGAAGAASRAIPEQPTLGEVDPEFTPMGGENLYNLGRTAVKGLTGLADDVAGPLINKYSSKLYQWGAPQLQKMEEMYRQAHPVFESLQKQGLFNGPRNNP